MTMWYARDGFIVISAHGEPQFLDTDVLIALLGRALLNALL
jgi:hypothetical protein